MKQLIVNADDFGADRCRDEGIAAAVAAGVVTAVSVLANGPATVQDLPLLLAWQRQGISVGLHFNLSEGHPRQRAPRLLVGRDGCFLGKTATQEALRRRGDTALEREIERELAAQIACLREMGLQIGHLDGHQHVHIFPAAFPAVLRAVVRYGIPRLRVPAEPVPVFPEKTTGRMDTGPNGGKGKATAAMASPPTHPVLAGTAPLSGRAGSVPDESLYREAAMFSRLAAAARPYLAGSAVGTTDHFRGLFLKGHLTLPRLEGVLRGLPDGTTELMVHPGRAPAVPPAGPFAAFSGAGREVELQALLAVRLREVWREENIALISHLETRR